MLVISSREFRNNQKKYFDMVDKQIEIIVRRGKDKSYLLTPLSESDKLSTSPALIKKIKEAEEAIKRGETVTIEDTKDIWKSIL